ncbi:MAG: DUF3592 domain-containing protein [Terriglobales bacterium]
MKPFTRIFLRVIGGACALIFVISLVTAAPQFAAQVKLLRDWQRTDAVVLRSEVVPVPTTSGGNLYDAQYTFGFLLPDGPHIATIGSNHLSTSAERKQRQVARFPAGSHHVILYNPADPREIRMQPGYNVHFFAVPVFISGVGAIFGAIALALLLVVRRGAPVTAAQAGAGSSLIAHS